MITKLQATALKGLSFTHDLAPCTIFTGANFAGKTARFDALRLAICGKLPELGARAKDTFDLSSGTRMECRAELDDGNSIARSYWLEKGSVKSDCQTTLGDEDLVKLAQSPLLNTGEYFAMTDSQKIQFVFQNCPMESEVTPNSIIARLKRVKLDETTEQTEDALNAQIEEVREAFKGTEVVDGITKLVNKEDGVLSTSFTQWSRRAKDSEGTVRILTELKLRENEASAETILHIEDKLNHNATALGSLQQQAGALAQASVAAMDRAALRDKLNAAINHPRPAYEKELAELDVRHKELAKLVSDDPMPTDDLAKSLYKVCVDTHATLGTAKKKAEEAKFELDNLKKMECCPFCKSVGEGWKETLRSTFGKQFDENDAKATELTAYYTLKKKEYESVNIAYAEKLKGWQTSEQARKPMVNIERDIANLRDAIERDTRDRGNARTLLAENPALEIPDNIETIRERVQAYKEEAQTLRNSRDMAKKLALDIARAAQAALEHNVAAAHVQVIKAFGKELKVIQQEIINDAFKGMLTVANKVAGDVLKSPLAYHEGEIGRWEGSRFISHKTFSGTEQAICHISIAAALSAKFPMKIVLLDELARIDDANTTKLLHNLSACVEDGTLDQVLVIDLRGTPREGWQIVSL